MSFGYLGDTSTKIKQQKKNDGILTIDDVRQLESLGQLGGSLQKLKTVSASSATNVDFTDIDSVHQYQQLLIYGHSITPSGDGTGYLRVSNDNGSNFRASGYYYAVMIFDGAGNADTSKSTSANQIEWVFGNGGASTNETQNFFVSIHNHNKSDRYTFADYRGTSIDTGGTILTTHGSASYATAETHNAFRFLSGGGGTLTGEFTLYGYKTIT